MRLIDILLRPAKAPDYSDWNPNAPEPFDALDKALFNLDKEITFVCKRPAGRITPEDLAQATMNLTKALRKSVEEQRLDSRSAAQWQLANFVIAVLALFVSIAAVVVDYIRP